MSVEESIAQLEAITERRNTLLRQMYHMLQRRNNVVSILEAYDSDDDDGVEEFLERHKISKEDPDTGSIALLDEDLLRPSESVPSEVPIPQESFVETPTSSLSKPPSPLETSPTSSMSPEPATRADEESLPLVSASGASRESSPLSEKDDSDNNVADTVQELVNDAFDNQDVEMEDAQLPESQPSDVQSEPAELEETQPVETGPQTPAAVRNNVMLSEADPESGPSVDTPSPSKRPTVILSDISNSSIDPSFVFRPPTPPVEVKAEPEESKPEEAKRHVPPHYEFKADYTLPPPGYANQYSAKKSKSSKTKKREKGRDNDPGQLGYYKWAASIIVNPVWKKVGRAQKCLSSHEWAIASQELRLNRVVERIETLKNGAKWALRQPKKQKNLGGTVKSHWDHLMEEMKWMRTDFREERKFKLALAYDLSTAVLEWHAAGSMQERLDKGICVLWKPPPEPTNDPLDQGDEAEEEAPYEDDDLQESAGMDAQGEGENEEESEDDAEPESVAMTDSTVPSHQASSSPQKAIKTEDTDVSASLEALEGTQKDGEEQQNNELSAEVQSEEKMQVDSAPAAPSIAVTTTETPPTNTASTSKSPSKSSYAGLRTVLAYSDANAFFFDPFSMSNSQTDAPDISNISNLTAIFPDLSMYNMLDTAPPPPPPSADGKKKSESRKYDKDDPYRRQDEMAYQKLYPAEPFMQSRVTLLGPLKPAQNWKDGKWLPLQEGPSLSEIENPSKITEDSMNALFDPRPSHNPLQVLAMQLQAYSARQDKEIKKRPSMHYWSAAEDALLKHLIDKYQINWGLIAETFNSSRPTISTDIRTPRDCMERWREKWMLGRGTEQMATPAPAEESSNQITTRGIKRQAAASVAAPSPGAAEFMGQESRKRRRHAYLQEAMRKAGKKRSEIVARQQANQRKPPQIHETHAQYAKLPRRTPAELSRMKAEKEAQDLQEMQALARRRQEELHRATITHVNAGGQADSQGPKTPQAAPNMLQRPGGQFVPQIRGMAQQQQQPRPGTATATTVGTALPGASRMSPQQLLQAQVQAATQQMQQARGQQAATAVAVGIPQTQPVPQATPQVQNATANGVVQANASHLSPPFTGRETTASPVHSSPHHILNTQPSNSPRPPSAQAIPHPQPQMQVNAGTRFGYYMPNIQGYTAEQIQNALRLQQQAQQQQAQQQQTQGPINYQTTNNNPATQ